MLTQKPDGSLQGNTNGFSYLDLIPTSVEPEESLRVNGRLFLADGVHWDPLSLGTNVAYFVAYSSEEAGWVSNSGQTSVSSGLLRSDLIVPVTTALYTVSSNSSADFNGSLLVASGSASIIRCIATGDFFFFVLNKLPGNLTITDFDNDTSLTVAAGGMYMIVSNGNDVKGFNMTPTAFT